jgi:nucleoside-diphosphate-sugar epimerase
MEKNGHLGEPESANAGYAWAKRMGERICSWAFAGTQTRYVIVRPTNAYGERDYYDEKAHVIPALVRKFTDGRKTVDVYGGRQTREFIHADDVARGMMIIAERGIDGHAYNLGTSGHTRVCISWLAKTIKTLAQSRAEINFVTDQPTGDEHRYTDSAKAMSLWWKYQINIEEGLESVIEEYRKSPR